MTAAVGVGGVDHLALPICHTEAMAAFYTGLGIRVDGLDAWRRGERPVLSLLLGDVKVHLHTDALLPRAGETWFLRADRAVPGCGDLCFEWLGGIRELLDRLTTLGVPVLDGPILRTGGRDQGTREGVSVYVRDPDGNLVELISYDARDRALLEPAGGGQS